MKEHYGLNKKCIDCDKIITDTSTRCMSCAGKIHWQRVHPPVYRICPICAVEFKIEPSRKKRFCSPGCYVISTKENAKGSVDKGYIRVVVDGKRKQLHRHLMEIHLGRTLERREHVHHVNGNTLDNRIENLVVMDISDHSSLHHKGKTVSPESRERMSEAAKRRREDHYETVSTSGSEKI